MKYFILIFTLFTMNVFAEDFHKFSLRYRTSPMDTISHLDIKNDIGIQWDFRRDLKRIFYEGSIYVSKANVSDTQGFRIGAGYTNNGHSISANYYGESNYEQWRIQEGDCKACNLDWINPNWRSNYFAKYRYDFGSISPFIQYHWIANDRDEMLDNRFTLGFDYSGSFLDRETFFRVKYDEHLTTFNIGFRY